MTRLCRKHNPSFVILCHQALSNTQILQWQKNLTFAPCQVVLKTLSNTTQLAPTVPSDCMDVPQCHLASRLLQLCHCRLKDTCCTDWFHSDGVSHHHNKGFHVFYFKKLKALFPYPKPRKAHMLNVLQSLCQEVGIPKLLFLDGDGINVAAPVRAYLGKIVLPYHHSEPECQNQNRGGKGGGILKHHLKRLHFNTNFDVSYWDFALEHIADVHNHLANKVLNDRPPLEVLTGLSVDISVFPFHFWQRVWFWDPHIQLPCHQWHKGRWLGCCKNVGDPFTYWVLPDQVKGKCHVLPLSRSVVRLITDESEAPPSSNDMVDLPVPDKLYSGRLFGFTSLDSILDTIPEEDILGDPTAEHTTECETQSPVDNLLDESGIIAEELRELGMDPIIKLL